MTTTSLSSLTKPIHHKQLNELQLELLTILYKFRFGTAQLISRYQEQSIRNTNVRLKNLLEQELIGRNYDGSYRINRRPWRLRVSTTIAWGGLLSSRTKPGFT
jgi:hypothetical protein